MAEILWNFFKKNDDNNDPKVRCDLCDMLIIDPQLDNLKNHLFSKHSKYINMKEILGKRKATKSYLWNHFKKAPFGHKAECNYCNKLLSYKTTIANLRKHLDRTHPHIDLNIKPEQNDKNDDSHTDGASDDDSVQAVTTTDVWSYFEKELPNRARCVICRDTFSRHSPYLKRHMKDKHPKIAQDLLSDSENEDNCYTEVIYQDDDEKSIKFDSKSTSNIRKHKREPQKRRRSSVNSINSNESDGEIENFGRYITGLLKKLPKDVCTKLQLDIINLIMTAKLNKIAKLSHQTVNSSIVQGVPEGAIIVTMPNNVTNSRNNSLTLVNK